MMSGDLQTVVPYPICSQMSQQYDSIAWASSSDKLMHLKWNLSSKCQHEDQRWCHVWTHQLLQYEHSIIGLTLSSLARQTQ